MFDVVLAEGASLVQGITQSAGTTQMERRAFLWMQGRMVELLLRHDVPRFEATFASREGQTHPGVLDDWLAHYRELAVVVYLQAALFEDILPRIKRRLSFEAPHESQIEALPTRGRLDWSRTLTHSWQSWPGEIPLEVSTRQRRRHFATPENLLTVVTILEYRQQVQGLLDNESHYDGVEALRHPLQEIIDGCHRQLSFIQFAGLLGQCENILNARPGSLTTEELEQLVEANLQPGSNNAYFDLLEWRRKLWSLGLLERDPATTVRPQEMLGSDPARDNYLYQMWLFYETADMLKGLGRLQKWEVSSSVTRHKMKLEFDWGGRVYRLQHDMELSPNIKYWDNAPGVRPDLYIERIVPPPQVITQPEGVVPFWQESGYMLDAKYYKPRRSPKAPGEPVKRMLTDLALTGTHNGTLLFAFLGARENGEFDPTEQEEDKSYIVEPSQMALATPGPRAVEVRRVCPGEVASSSRTIHKELEALLERVHQQLAPVPAIGCHGFFLDEATSNGDGIGRIAPTLLGVKGPDESGSGSGVTAGSARWLVCPKPHLGPGRADIVNYETDCLKNRQVCHVIGQTRARRPLSIPRKLEDLPATLEALKASVNQEYDEQAVQQEFIEFTRRYAALSDVNLDYYIVQFRDNNLHGVADDHPLLTREHYETLALGKYLWEQLDRIKAHDFSGPGLHFSGVMEALVSATVFKDCAGLVGSWMWVKKQTLGTLPYLRLNKHKDGPEGHDWPLIEAWAGRHWQARISDEPLIDFEFDNFVKQLDSVAQLRNQAAHPGHFTRDQLVKLWQMLFVQTKVAPVGMLPSILRCWQVS